jgi:hypothetical protein
MNQKDRKLYGLGAKGKDFFKSDHSWLAQYEEECDFLCGKVPSSLPDFTEDE